jgi:hypothetical protein
LSTSNATPAIAPIAVGTAAIRLEAPPKVNVSRPAPVEPGQPAVVRLPANISSGVEERSPLGNGLNAKSGAGMRDLQIVLNLFEHYREEFDGFPVGEDNQSMVNALTGNNPERITFLPPDHPAINDRGELTDRWGSPFYFHLISRHAIEIRSAGPDQRIYTNDDQVLLPRDGSVLMLARGENPDAG